MACRRLASRQLTTSDVVRAIREQNIQVAAGVLGAPPAPSDATFQLYTSREFNNEVIAANYRLKKLQSVTPGLAPDASSPLRQVKALLQGN